MDVFSVWRESQIIDFIPNPYISRMVAKAHDVVDMMIQRGAKLNVVTYIVSMDGHCL